MIYSFDIFDTLITRKTYTPQGVFLVLQNRLSEINIRLPIGEMDSFALVREDAEIESRRRANFNGNEEITIDDIYDIIEQKLPLTHDECEKIKRLEIEIELDVTCGIRRNIDIIKQYFSEGKRVILISDMYLSVDTIRRMLVKTDPIFEEITIYVSSEFKKTKQSGNLYKLISEKEKTEYSEWIHCGDNEVSDIAVPARLGITTKPIVLPKTNYIDFSNEVIREIFNGIVREKTINGDILNIGAVYGEVILLSYVTWILTISTARNIRRLYFMARDGYVLKMIADMIIKKKKYPITTKYIYGSRASLRADKMEDYTKAKNYFLQEIDISDNHFAMVDTNSTGISMSYVSKMLERSPKRKLEVFYYFYNINVSCDDCNNHVFSEYSRLNISSNIIELFCRAPHTTTLFYRENNDRYSPVFLNKPFDESYILYLEKYFSSIKKLSDELTDYTGGIDFCSLLSNRISNEIIDIISEYNNPDLNDFLGGCLQGDGVEDLEFAPAFTEENIHDLYLMEKYGTLYNFYKGNSYILSLKRTKNDVFEYLDMGIRSEEFKHYFQYKKDIIIYGAGKIGKLLFEFVNYDTCSKISGWADKNYEIIHDDRVRCIDDCLKNDYDMIVIAMVKNQDEVKRMLISKGVEEKKITNYKDFLDSCISF